jgi:UDP-N-acetylmuramoyl-tripeptide--D-alanyl-D-alanine ligase
MRKKFFDFYCNLLAFFARRYIKKHKPFVIWINWSVGKTSARMIIYQTLCKYINNKKVYTSSKNFNWELWLSLSIFQIEEFNPSVFWFIKIFFNIIIKTFFGSSPYDILILEYWIDRPLEMEFLLEIVQPHMGVFTAIDSVHSLQFGNPAEIAKEEKKMIQNTLEFSFLNINDQYAMSLLDDIEIDYLTYQTEAHNSNWDISFENEKFFYEWGKLLVNFDLKIREKNINITTNILWKAHYGYIWVSLAILDIVNYKEGKQSIFDKFNELFLEYKLQSGRLSVFNGINDSIIFDSTYNSSPLSVKKILNTVHNIKKDLFPYREVWVMLWDMRELWDLTELDHRKVAWYVQSIADKVFLVWENMKKYLKDELEKIGFDMSLVYYFDDSISLWNFVKKELKKDKGKKMIIGKGSQNTIFLEEAIKLLLQNSQDSEKLTRQSNWWKKRKDKWFNLIGNQ